MPPVLWLWISDRLPRLSYLGPWEEVGGWGFPVFAGGVFVAFAAFLGLTFFDFLVSLDFKLGNTSLHRSWCREGGGWGAR